MEKNQNIRPYLKLTKVPKKWQKCENIILSKQYSIISSSKFYIVKIDNEKYTGKINRSSLECTCAEDNKSRLCKHLIILHLKNKITLFDTKDIRRFMPKKRGRPKNATPALQK